MKKHQKQSAIENLETRFASSQAAFLVNFQGMSVAHMKALRFALDDKGGSLKVAKNRLARLALKDVSKCHGLDALLKGQLAYVFAQDEITSVAKILTDFAKKNDRLKIVAACSDSKIYDAKSVAILGSLPSREVLLSQLCGVLNAPVIVFALAIKAVAEKKAQA
ncbi:50S ribosomal protein L10 [Candidatus Babeliales bacterium]|nr:50S ribosomal protein L10 [Candidatus Babeliales bacterium]MBP9843635.1 50S ribosomal protein L10 [Candidatus Babeliales bacterium]